MLVDVSAGGDEFLDLGDIARLGSIMQRSGAYPSGRQFKAKDQKWD
jgi:hypothetical protein